jgi:large subunit ribosomal protein L17
MRHLRAGNHLSRTSAHRTALMRNLAVALIRHERIRTTLPKARNLRPFVEKLVTLSRDGSVHHRRLAKAKLGNKHDEELKKLFEVLGPRFRGRPGGYTRILKLAKRRLGDGGEQAIIEFVEKSAVEVEAPPPETAAEAPRAKRGKKAAAGA